MREVQKHRDAKKDVEGKLEAILKEKRVLEEENAKLHSKLQQIKQQNCRQINELTNVSKKFKLN